MFTAVTIYTTRGQDMKLSVHKGWVLTLLSEAAGLLLLISFVVAVATMPLKTARDEKAIGGWAVSINQPLWKARLTEYKNTILSGSLGLSRKKEPVGPLVSASLGRSLKLVGYAGLIALIPGVLKGLWDFRQLQRRRGALGSMLVGAVQGLPDFWVILWVQIGAAYATDWLPWFRLGHTYDPLKPLTLLFPVIALAMIPWAYIARLTTMAMTHAYERDYIRTARSKGLHELIIMVKHGFRGALVQMLDSLPNVAAMIFSNLLIVEFWFAYPGLALLLKDAIQPPVLSRFDPPASPDVPLLVAAGVALGMLFWLFYLTIRVLRRLADPRLRKGAA